MCRVRREDGDGWDDLVLRFCVKRLKSGLPMGVNFDSYVFWEIWKLYEVVDLFDPVLLIFCLKALQLDVFDQVLLQ